MTFRHGLNIANFNFIERAAFKALPQEVRSLFEYYEKRNEDYKSEAGAIKIGMFIRNFAFSQQVLDEVLTKIFEYLELNELVCDGNKFYLPLDNFTTLRERLSILNMLLENPFFEEFDRRREMRDDISNFKYALNVLDKCIEPWPSHYFLHTWHRIPDEFSLELSHGMDYLSNFRYSCKNLSIFLNQSSKI